MCVHCGLGLGQQRGLRLGNSRLGRGAAAVPAAGDERGQFRQRRLRAALDGSGGREILADLPRVVVEVDELLARLQCLDTGGLALREQIGTDADHQIMIPCRRAQRRGHARHRAGEQRVIAGEGGPVGHPLHVYRRADGLGKGRHLGKGLRVGHAVPGKDDGIVGRADQFGGACHRASIAAQRRPDAGGGADIQILWRDGVQDVAGNGEEHRAGGRGERHLGGAAHGARQLGDAGHLERPFAQRPRHGGQIVPQQRLGQPDRHVLLAGCHQHRRAGLRGVVEHAHGVPQPGRGVQVAHGEPAGGLGPAIGHAHHHHLVEAQHIAQALFHHEGIEQRQFGGAGVAEDDLDAFRMEDVEEEMLAGPALLAAHGIISSSVTGGRRTLPSSSPAPGR